MSSTTGAVGTTAEQQDPEHSFSATFAAALLFRNSFLISWTTTELVRFWSSLGKSNLPRQFEERADDRLFCFNALKDDSTLRRAHPRDGNNAARGRETTNASSSWSSSQFIQGATTREEDEWMP